ncbi:hypothetical protein GMB34_11680 [Turicibacter sanguinis]|nr:hypothetical protein [Turicibacter sanguinis]MTN84853.1 hypothetical protein [Turicibacter sanguinis]MTN87675.1 hypothetical protein [Turicibacter sanguinis]MTN90497.1 hypothetical protein [Turicibacter sanguinis]MTN93419.1 hypothetical protein [Turicibacter sanguinis]
MAKRNKSGFHFEVKGYDNLMRRLDSLEVDGEDLCEIIDTVEDEIISTLKANAPVDPLSPTSKHPKNPNPDYHFKKLKKRKQQDHHTEHGVSQIDTTRRTGNKYKGFGAEKWGVWNVTSEWRQWKSLFIQNFMTDSPHYLWFNKSAKEIKRKVTKKLKKELIDLYTRLWNDK